MSELKEHMFCECDEYTREYHGQLSNEMRPYYLKSEADKVIAEKDKKIDLYKRGWEENDRIVGYLYKSERHHKYKRCLAMAKYCGTQLYLENHCRFRYPTHRKFWERWRKRWLVLAEKFKEAK